MPLVLVVGDLHIPNRASGIPEQFRKMFTPGRIQHVIITGNLCNKEMFDYFKTITSEVHCVKGEYDEWNKDLPETLTLEIEDLKFGVVHGHQVIPWGDKDTLACWQRKLDVDVLISGQTHSNKTFEFDGLFFVNPGSITGAFTSTSVDVTPSFVLMDVKENTVTAFSYQYAGADQDLKIKKKTWTKGQ